MIDHRSFYALPVSLLTLVLPLATANLPYNPTRVLSSRNGSEVYTFSQSNDQFSFGRIDTSHTFNTSGIETKILTRNLPFLSDASSKAFTPLINADNDVTILVGKCSDGADGSELWRWVPSGRQSSGNWSQLRVSSSETELGADFLSAGISFSPTNTSADAVMYIFGGMCPNFTSSSGSWTSDAIYSNEMLSIVPDQASLDSPPAEEPYSMSLSASRGPPIPEAGLTMTPLLPSITNITSTRQQQSQNFVLLGGHTQQAFINMSQVALFSLPQASWAFLGIDDPPASQNLNGEGVEPRSGHTAVLTPEGDKIILLGGWVGDVDTPASPQLAALNVGAGYGGSVIDWSWSIPNQTDNPFKDGEGIYGHAAVMLPGGIMMVTGGYSISAPPSKWRTLFRRQSANPVANTKYYLYNATSSAWVSEYANPSSPDSPASNFAGHQSGSLKSAGSKVGLGVGLTLGLAAIAGIVLVWFFYSRGLRQKRRLREQELRELALGAERYHSGDFLDSGIDGGVDGRGGTGGPDARRSASWSARQENRIGLADGGAPVIPARHPSHGYDDQYYDTIDRGQGADRTGVYRDVPSPTRGLRRSLKDRAPMGFGLTPPAPISRNGPDTSIHMIEEEEEISEAGSVRRKKSAERGTLADLVAANEAGNRASVVSDPFKDPMVTEKENADPGKSRRDKEAAGWVNDWTAAADAMDKEGVSRQASKATHNSRTYSSLSNSAQHSSGRGSPEKGNPSSSDRTGSNLSERSAMSSSGSLQRSQDGGSLFTRTMSLRSASAGYNLFAGAAAAMAARVTGQQTVTEVGQPTHPARTGSKNVSRAPSKRSVSLNHNSNSSRSSRFYASLGQSKRDRSETFSTAHTSFEPSMPPEREALLSRGNGRARPEQNDLWMTPPESPIKERHAPPQRSWMGSMKRVFTGDKEPGTGTSGVKGKIAHFENKNGTSPSPTKSIGDYKRNPEMAEKSDSGRKSSALFLKTQRGPEDWQAEKSPSPTKIRAPKTTISPSSIKRKPVLGAAPGPSKDSTLLHSEDDAIDDDWDPEEAVQQRVVQVMFTVPKEKLRVVNADQLSILSKSSVDFEGGENESGADVGDLKRMQSVRSVRSLKGISGQGVTTGNANRVSTVVEGDELAEEIKMLEKEIEIEDAGEWKGKQRAV